jgi:hypothetical protein
MNFVATGWPRDNLHQTLVVIMPFADSKFVVGCTNDGKKIYTTSLWEAVIDL